MKCFAMTAIAASAMFAASMPAAAQSNLYVETFNKTFEEVLHEARQFAFYGVERCHRDAIDQHLAGSKVSKDSCDQLSKAAEAYERARIRILRERHVAQSQKEHPKKK